MQGASMRNANRSFIKELVYNRYLYLLTLPGIVFFFIFNYLPLVGILIAFQDFNPIKGILGSQWIGLKNFDFFFNSNDWKIVSFNTLYLNTLFILTGLAAAVIVAIMLSEVNNKSYKKISQSMIILPNFISWPIVAMFATALFSSDTGLINLFIKALGGQQISFYMEPKMWPLIFVLLRLWKGAGIQSVIFLATIVGIDQEMYESAQIDGATKWQRIIHITIPLLKNTAILLFLLSVGGIFYGDFGMIYTILGDNPILYSTTDVIDTFVFRSLRNSGAMGMAAAVGLYQSVVGFIIVIFSNQITKKYNQDAALF
jgi:putative aldouronate transport system permease protein